MKKIMCISDSYPQHPRLEKIANYYNTNTDSFIEYILWNREIGKQINSFNTHIYNSKAKLGSKISKLLKLPGFLLYILKTLKLKKPEIIICRYWQVFIFISLFYYRNTKIIYDVCDMPSNKLIKTLEKKLIKRAHLIVLASRYFKTFYKHDNLTILENRVNSSLVKFNHQKEIIHNDIFQITYLGKIRYFKILKNLVDSVVDIDDINLNFYGDGPDLNKLKKYCSQKEMNNISFYGRYAQSDISSIYQEADLIWCAYPNDNLNVKYAISNKFFETLAFKVPGVFSESTMLGEEISNHNIGFLVNPNSSSFIKKLILEILRNKMMIQNVIENIKMYQKDIYWEDYLLKKDLI